MDSAESVSPAAFVSYAHEDRAIASALAFGLQKRGCEVWIDEGELRAGDSLVERLADGISQVDFVIAIVSEHSVRSPWCAKELSLAMTQEIDLEGRFGIRRILPLRVGRVEMPLMLRDKLYLEVNRERPGELVPRLWEDIAGHAKVSDPVGARDGSPAERAYEVGVNLYNKGELASARRHLHRASQESHHAAALLLGEILYDQGEVDKAADEWQFAAGSPQPELSHAAVVHYGRMLATHEFSDGGRLAGPRGALIGGRGREEAEKLWRMAAESSHPDAPWAWLGLGRLLEDPPVHGGEPDPARAEEAFERAAHSGHGESRTYALFKLGRIKWKRGDTEGAISVLDVGAMSSDHEWAPWCAFELGRIYWEAQDDARAVDWWYRAASAGHPRISEAAQEALDNPRSIWRVR